MKQFYFSIVIVLAAMGFAHAQDTTSLEGKMQFIFAQLDRNDISTGFLKERGFPRLVPVHISLVHWHTK